MKKPTFLLLAAALLALPFLVVPNGWNAGYGAVCLKESIVFGFALLGYYWMFSVVAGKLWARLGANSERQWFPAFMGVGVTIAVVYTWLMTNWDWDMRYMWSACQAAA